MSHKPVLCIQVSEEIHLRLLEERHVEDYFALIEHNHAYLQRWIAVEAYEGSVETLRAYQDVKGQKDTAAAEEPE